MNNPVWVRIWRPSGLEPVYRGGDFQEPWQWVTMSADDADFEAAAELDARMEALYQADLAGRAS